MIAIGIVEEGVDMRGEEVVEQNMENPPQLTITLMKQNIKKILGKAEAQVKVRADGEDIIQDEEVEEEMVDIIQDEGETPMNNGGKAVEEEMVDLEENAFVVVPSTTLFEIVQAELTKDNKRVHIDWTAKI